MLKINATKLGNVAVLGLQGQIVNGQTEILRNAVRTLSGFSAVKLDLAGVTTVDAGGLGLMLQLREDAEAEGIRFELMNLSRQISRVFEITRLDSVFRITSGVEFLPAVSRSPRAPVVAFASCA